jgi:hypothetical protein
MTRLSESTTRTCSPIFLETFVVDVPHASHSQVEVTLWDVGEPTPTDTSGFLGEVLVNVSELLPSSCAQVFEVNNSDSIKIDAECTGNMRMKLVYLKDDSRDEEGERTGPGEDILTADGLVEMILRRQSELQRKDAQDAGEKEIFQGQTGQEAGRKQQQSILVKFLCVDCQHENHASPANKNWECEACGCEHEPINQCETQVVHTETAQPVSLRYGPVSTTGPLFSPSITFSRRSKLSASNPALTAPSENAPGPSNPE